MHEALELLKKYDTVIIHRHTNPDGDAMGSQIGLKNLLLDNFPEKKVYAVGDGAGRFSFMDGSVMDEIPDETYKGALAVILDSAEHSLVSDDRYTLAEKPCASTTTFSAKNLPTSKLSKRRLKAARGSLRTLQGNGG